MSNSYLIKGSLKVYLVINSPPTQEYVVRTKNWRWKAEAKISFNIGAKRWTAAQEQDTVEETDSSNGGTDLCPEQNPKYWIGWRLVQVILSG